MSALRSRTGCFICLRIPGREKPCKDILDAFEIGDFSKEKRKQYDKDMYDEKRRNGELAAARNDGRAEGKAEGLDREIAICLKSDDFF